MQAKKEEVKLPYVMRPFGLMAKRMEHGIYIVPEPDEHQHRYIEDRIWRLAVNNGRKVKCGQTFAGSTITRLPQKSADCYSAHCAEFERKTKGMFRFDDEIIDGSFEIYLCSL
jgi:hypothetical protein